MADTAQNHFARGAAATCVTKRSMYDDNNAGGADQSNLVESGNWSSV